MNVGQNDLGQMHRTVLEHVQQQQWHCPCLYVVATPIGNLGDLSLRAMSVLNRVDLIACEDTRNTQILLNHMHSTTPLMAAHQHNEVQAATQVISLLAQGKTVALVSDAGAPAVSDPGAKLVQRVREAGYRVCPIPGSSAVITAMMACGFATDEQPSFAFAGFVPSKKQARAQWLEAWVKHPFSVVMYESPHRIAQTLEVLSQLLAPQRQVMIGRELTKRFEEIAVLEASALMAWFEASDQRHKGEFVLVVEPAVHESPRGDYDDLAAALLAHGLSVRDCSGILHKTLGLPKSEAYDTALAAKQRSD